MDTLDWICSEGRMSDRRVSALEIRVIHMLLKVVSCFPWLLVLVRGSSGFDVDGGR